jgi:hypothetical protein
MLEIVKGMLQNLLTTKSTCWVDSITIINKKAKLVTP